MELCGGPGRKRSSIHRFDRDHPADDPLHQGESPGDDFTHQFGAGGELECLDQFGDAQFAGSVRTSGDARFGRSRGHRPSAGRHFFQSRAVRRVDAGSFRAGGSSLARAHASHRGLPNLIRKTSLAFATRVNHVVHGFNAAKGGDPMSHGSAEGSVRIVQEVMR